MNKNNFNRLKVQKRGHNKIYLINNNNKIILKKLKTLRRQNK